MWYASKVGQTVPFVRETNDGYWSREDAGYLNIVRKTDAEIVEFSDEPTLVYETGPGFTITLPVTLKPPYDVSIVSDEEISNLRQMFRTDLEFAHELIKLVIERIK